jgi:hypothetical protein
MKVVFFVHALSSCWNNGNAHFLRGVATALIRKGHTVEVWEPRDRLEPRRTSCRPRRSAWTSLKPAFLPSARASTTRQRTIRSP